MKSFNLNTSASKIKFALKKMCSYTALATSLLCVAGQAHAGIWQLDDGFDYRPADTWSFWAAGTGAGGFELNTGTARSPNNNAWIYSTNGWSDVGRYVKLSPYRLHSPLTCAAQIYVQGIASKGQLEVIDTAGWTYRSVKPFAINSASYTGVLTNSWTPGGETVFVRVGLIGVSGSFMFARVDDLTVQCVYKY